MNENHVDDRLRYVWHTPVHCPACGGTKHRTYRTEWHDGVKSHRKRCRTCSHKFILLFESDDSTNLENS